MLAPVRRINVSTTFKNYLCIAALGTIGHHLVGISNDGAQARRLAVKSKANRIENRSLSRSGRARNAEHAAICKIRRFKINRPFARKGIDIAKLDLLNLHRSLLCVLMRFRHSFVKQTNKLVVLAFHNFGIVTFFCIRGD